jgi:RNA polymerase sigma-70 factor (ECF subfamily)
MEPSSAVARTRYRSDFALAQAVVAGDRAAFEQVMRGNNQALFRVARAIMKDDSDAEDALQDAYIAAFAHMTPFVPKRSFALGSRASSSTNASRGAAETNGTPSCNSSANRSPKQCCATNLRAAKRHPSRLRCAPKCVSCSNAK